MIKRNIGLLFICILFTLMFSACKKQQAALPALSVHAIQLKESTIPIYRDYIGITESISNIEIKARVEGFLEQMLFVEGDVVKKDQLLFVIDKKPFIANLELQEGSLVKAMADQDFRRLQLNRMKTLVKNKYVSQSHYDEADAQYKAAQGNVQMAKAEVEQAKINLGYCSMYSPFDGLIGKRYVAVGNLVGNDKTNTTLLAKVVQLNPIYVEFSPALNDFALFLDYTKNMPFPAEVTLRNSHLVFHGKVNLVNNEANKLTGTILMRVIIDNPDSLLRPGIYVTVHLKITDDKKAILVPNIAVTETQGQHYVFIVNAHNEVETRSVVIDGNYKQNAIVSSGLKVGDVVILDNISKLKSGVSVIPQLSEAGIKND